MIFVGVGAFCQKPASVNRAGSFLSLNNVQSGTNHYFLSNQPVRPDQYVKQLGFFCKKELQFEKLTKVPLKMRLGSVEQCDWLEGKYFKEK